MSTSNFSHPVALPCFIGDDRKFDIWANGCIYGRQSYDGFKNRIEITPTVCPPGHIHSCIPVGESYWIGQGHLTGLICERTIEKLWPGATKNL